MIVPEYVNILICLCRSYSVGTLILRDEVSGE